MDELCYAALEDDTPTTLHPSDTLELSGKDTAMALPLGDRESGPWTAIASHIRLYARECASRACLRDPVRDD